MISPRVCISILNWNGGAKTVKCLESLQHLTYPNFYVLVVDNASSDDSVQQIRAAFPGIDIICSLENGGYAAGHRLALDRAKQERAELFWILNNDATLKPDSLDTLVEVYLRRGEGLYGGLIVDAADEMRIRCRIWALGPDRHPQYLTEPVITWGELLENWVKMPERQVANIAGSSFMVPLSVVEKYGFMDTSFFMYGEETDYCFRLGRAGVPSFVVPSSIIAHDCAGSVQLYPEIDPLIQYYKIRNQLRVIKTHMGYQAYFAYVRKSLRKNACIKQWVKAGFSAGRLAATSPLQYYRCLGVWHSFLNHTGKTFAPEDYLEGAR